MIATTSLAELATATRAELDALLPRMRDNVIWTAQEIRLAAWLVSKAVVRQGATFVEIVVPGGRANQRLGYLLYACLERAAEQVGLVQLVEGYTRDNVHGLVLPQS